MRTHPTIFSLLSLVLVGCGAVPKSRKEMRPRPAASSNQPDFTSSVTAQQCATTLGKTGARFSALPDKFYGAGCSTLNSVRLDEVSGDKGGLGVTNLGVVSCPLANSFAGWARFGVDRAARQILGSPLVRVETMGSYSCRNVAGTRRLSAHSRAEAIDIAAFVLADGRRISVLNGWNASKKEREFLRTVHGSACKRFGTVLGPEYNAAHRDHFHLELGNGSFCR